MDSLPGGLYSVYTIGGALFTVFPLALQGCYGPARLERPIARS